MNPLMSFPAAVLGQLLPILPIIITSFAAVIVLVLIGLRRNHFVTATFTVVALNLALISVLWLMFRPGAGAASVGSLMRLDAMAYFYQLFLLVGSLACTTLAYPYLAGYRNNREEYYALLLVSVTGALVLVCASHFASFFVGLELLSVPMYGLLAYTHEREQSLEAGLKYMVLSAAASAMLLMGMAFLYSYSGSLEFLKNGQAFVNVFIHSGSLPVALVALGFGLIVTAIGFKLSLVPMHTWTPDVYQGSPAPASTLLASVGKIAVVVVLVRYLLDTLLVLTQGPKVVIMVLAVLSVIIGNLLALRQNNIKRVVGYSSIAHMGYVLLILAAAPTIPVDLLQQFKPNDVLNYLTFLTAPIGVYLVTYLFSTLGIFGVVSLMSTPYQGNEAQMVDDYRGLFWRRPVLSAVMTVMLLSLAGIPLTGGFIAKFLVIQAMVYDLHWGLAAVVIIGSGIGLFYYLRVLVVLFMNPTGEPVEKDAQDNWAWGAGGIMVLLSALLILAIGIYPEPLIKFAQMAQMLL